MGTKTGTIGTAKALSTNVDKIPFGCNCNRFTLNRIPIKTVPIGTLPDMSRIHAHRMIEAAEIRDNLLPTGNIFVTNW
jgi:hypothetical protein